MHQVFEKFLEQLFTKYFTEFEVDTQTTKQAWIEQEWVEQEDNAELLDEGKALNIRTDILLWSKPRATIPEFLIDAKYKRRISSPDRYELGFYIHEYGTEHGFAILPISPEDKQNNQTPNDTLITSKKHTPPIKIHIKHIDIDSLVDLIFSQEKDSIKKTEIEKLITA